MEAILVEVAKYIRPELLILVVVAWIVGFFLKKNDKFSNFAICIALWFICVVLAVGYLLVFTIIAGWRDILLIVLTAITQGTIIAFVSMGSYDTWKNTGKYLSFMRFTKLLDEGKGEDDGVPFEGGDNNA